MSNFRPVSVFELLGPVCFEVVPAVAADVDDTEGRFEVDADAAAVAAGLVGGGDRGSVAEVCERLGPMREIKISFNPRRRFKD